MKDVIGQPLAIGDYVLFTEYGSSDLRMATIIRFTKRNARVKPTQGYKADSEKGILKSSSTLIKITEQYKYFTETYPELLL